MKYTAVCFECKKVISFKNNSLPVYKVDKGKAFICKECIRNLFSKNIKVKRVSL